MGAPPISGANRTRSPNGRLPVARRNGGPADQRGEQVTTSACTRRASRNGGPADQRGERRSTLTVAPSEVWAAMGAPPISGANFIGSPGRSTAVAACFPFPLSIRACAFPAHGLPTVFWSGLRSLGVADGAHELMQALVVEPGLGPPSRLTGT